MCFLVILLFFVYLQYSSAFTTDYCAPYLCNGATHIACKNTGAYGTACSSDRHLVNLSRFKDFIVDRHNYYRNLTASGQISKFQKASRMATMVWDDELAYLAELHVKRCTFQHDQCRNTDNFRNAGQNLAWRWNRSPIDTKTILSQAIDSWFDENSNANIKCISSFHKTPKSIGHFTLMVTDKNIRVGCSSLYQPYLKGGTEYFITCNYATTNIYGAPVYKTGPTTSECVSGVNPIFSGLCGVEEDINPNLCIY